MSVTSQKALVGENGVRDYLNLWYPTHTPDGEEIVGQNKVVRIRSSGSKDIGDIGGVSYVSIEVKNHNNPKLSSLLDNAEWKGSNAGVNIWWLVHKRAGYGQQRAGYWHSVTTVGSLVSGLRLTREDGSPIFEEPWEISRMCADKVDMVAVQHANLYGIVQPKYRWRFQLVFRNYTSGLEQKKLADITANGDVDIDRGIVPIVISPRVGNYEHPAKWYASTLLRGLARTLETVGVLPQDVREYEGKEHAYE